MDLLMRMDLPFPTARPSLLQEETINVVPCMSISSSSSVVSSLELSLLCTIDGRPDIPLSCRLVRIGVVHSSTRECSSLLIISLLLPPSSSSLLLILLLTLPITIHALTMTIPPPSVFPWRTRDISITRNGPPVVHSTASSNLFSSSLKMSTSSSPSFSSSLSSPPRLIPSTDHPGHHHSISISSPPPPPPPHNTPTLDSILQHHLMMLPQHPKTIPTTHNSPSISHSQSTIHQSPLHYIRVPAPPNSSPSIPSHHPSMPTVPLHYLPSSHMPTNPIYHIPGHPHISVSQSPLNHMLTPPPTPPSLPHPLLSYIDRSLSIIINDQHRHNAMICSLIRNIRAYIQSTSIPHPHSSTLHSHTQPSTSAEEPANDIAESRDQGRKRSRPSEEQSREQIHPPSSSSSIPSKRWRSILDDDH